MLARLAAADGGGVKETTVVSAAGAAVADLAAAFIFLTETVFRLVAA